MVCYAGLGHDMILYRMVCHAMIYYALIIGTACSQYNCNFVTIARPSPTRTGNIHNLLSLLFFVLRPVLLFILWMVLIELLRFCYFLLSFFRVLLTRCYLPGGVKVDSFIYSPLLPSAVRGSSYDGIMHVSDWLPTILDLAGNSLSIHYFPTISSLSRLYFLSQ